jgi:hypothetical protein
VEWIHVVSNGDKRYVFEVMLMNSALYQKVANFLNSWSGTGFSTLILLQSYSTF